MVAEADPTRAAAMVVTFMLGVVYFGMVDG